MNNSPSLFVNAAAWGLLITGKLTTNTSEKNMGSALSRMISKGGAPLIRQGVNYAMRLLGKQFVTGQTIEEALQNGKEREKMGYRFSFDSWVKPHTPKKMPTATTTLRSSHSRHR